MNHSKRSEKVLENAHLVGAKGYGTIRAKSVTHDSRDLQDIAVPIRLPISFTNVHRQLARRFVQGEKFTQREHALLIEAFDLLRGAEIIGTDDRQSFAACYEQVIETRFANQYLRSLQQAPNVAIVAEQMRAQVSRQILPLLQAAGVLDPNEPLSFYLLAYCLYWWYAFARGYAFEVEVLQDLDAAGIRYVAHDLLDVQMRRSPFDVIIFGFRGDIKTSTYFLGAVRTADLLHDFYITRLFERRGKLWTVFLQEQFWKIIDNEKQMLRSTTLAELVTMLPGAFQMKLQSKTLIVVDYEAWKRLVLNVQNGEISI